MAINPNNGVLDIVNGVLKVSSIDIKESGGFATAINTVARNDVLLYDDQHTNTTFLPAEGTDYRSTAGVSRDTYSIDFNDGWVYWPLKLPNSWHAQFDMRITATGGVFTFSLFNTSTPNHTDYTANDGGYKIVFDNTNNQIDVYWEGSVHATVSANVRSTDWQHVNINYFRGGVSVSLAGKVVLNHGFTENYQEVDSRYVGFSATSGTSHEIRNLAVHNSDKWLYTKTSNASDITYVSGNVGIGTLTPTELLDVHGNVHVAKDLTVNGNLRVSGTTTFIDTQNLAIEDPIIEVARGNASDTIDAGLVITRATSNVAVAYRGDEEELALGYTQSGASDTDVTPITDGGLDVRVYGNLFANNLTTTANVEATYLKGDGSEITQVTLDQVVGYANTTANTIQLTNSDVGLKATGNVEANYFVGNGSKLTGLVTDLQSVTDNGNTTSNTVQFTNATTALIADSNVGIGTSTPSANLHVMGYQYVNGPPTLANAFDHSDAPLTLTHGTPTSTTAIDDPKAVLHLARDGTSGESYGARASFNLSRYENSGTASRSRLDVALADGTYAESTVMTLRADGKVGVGTDTPAYTLDVAGDINLSGDFYQGGLPFVSSLWTSGNDSLYYRSNVEVGTANLFVDTTTSNVGIGTTTPGYTLDVRGTANVGALTATSISGPLSGNADTATALQTARTIGGESFDGTANIDLPGVNTVGTQNTSGNAATATALQTARTIGGESFDGTANIDLPGVNTVGTQNTSGNAATATALQTARTIGGVSFDGTAGINLPGVNTAGTQNTSGNAATATALETARTIGGVSFDGTAGINLPGVNTAGTQNTSGNADTATTATNQSGGTVSATTGTFSGNVGIGTNNPKAVTHVGKLSANSGTFNDIPQSNMGISATFPDSTRLWLSNRTSATGEDYWGMALGTKYTGDIYIQSVNKNSTAIYDLLLQPNGGNVGIGTTSPGYKLDVNGTVNATSYTLTGDTTPHKQSIKNGTNLAVGWYRIAENGNAVDTASNGSRCSARFTIIDYDSGLHSTRTLYAGGTYGNKPFIHLLTNTSYGADGNISKVRVVEGSTYEGLAVEIYVDTACNANEIRIVMDDNYQGSGFTMVNFESVVANHSNMNEYELDLNTTFWGMFLDNTTKNICMLESGNVGIGTASPDTTLDVAGSINNGTYAINNGYMANRSLSIGDHALNYGGGNGWNSNTAGLMMECLNNTEIAIHDSGTRVASFMYFEGGSTNRFTIGRNMGWGGISTLALNGNVGIGTTSPAYKLDVNGDARIDRTYTLVDNIVAQQVVSSTTQTVEFTGLDLAGDGGTYKIVISMKNATNNNPSMSMYINNVTTSSSYYRKISQHTGGTSLSTSSNEHLFTMGRLSEHHHEFILTRHAKSGYPICTGTGMFHTGTTKHHDYVQGWDLHAWVYYGNVNVTNLKFDTYPYSGISAGSVFTIYKYV